MSPYNKPAQGRDNKKPYAANDRNSSKPGTRSEGHRGFRADQGAAPKQRWNADDRAARTGDRPSNSTSRDDRRPDWTPREKPAYGDRNAAPRTGGARPDRPSYGDRPARPAYGDRPARPAYGDRPNRVERPAYGDRSASAARTERPSYGDRSSAPRSGGSDRPSYGDRNSAPRTGGYDRNSSPRTGGSDRPARTERPPYGERPATSDRAPRTERPSYADRAERTERPSSGARTERPAYGDRPATSDRAPRTERPSYADRAERTERPSYGARTERPAYGSRTERPAYADRATSDRAPREARDSAYYPSRDSANKSHSGGGMQEDVVLERLEAAVITAKDVEGISFGDLGLGDNICRQLASMGAEAPFAIQAATIPDVLAGKDVLGRGKTGSGKTIAFGAPLVERLMANNGGKDRQVGRKPRALILAPTRELALQIDRTVQPIARSVGLFTTTIVGGVPQYKQVSALQRGVDIVIATPGRVEDLIEQGRLDLSNVIVTVLDEADHMCDLGFLEPVQRILQETSKGGQKLLFSATLDKGVATLVKQFLVNPAVHEVAGEDQASSTIDHKVLLIEQRDKRAIIQQLAGGEGKTLIFTRTRAFAEEMSDFLEDSGIPATSLHGDLNQSRRTRNLQLLTSGRVNVLVATDVAARGIHVDDITLVIQADAPEEYKTYLHRSGRTGRAGKVGTVVTLIPRARRRRMDELLDRADIRAEMINAAPGDSVLEKLAAL
jgi:superfamily II DNA/RNA helicase